MARRPETERGFVAFGAALRHPRYVAAHTDAHLPEEARLQRELPSCLSSVCLAPLRRCAPPRADHLLRTLPPDFLPAVHAATTMPCQHRRQHGSTAAGLGSDAPCSSAMRKACGQPPAFEISRCSIKVQRQPASTKCLQHLAADYLGQPTPTTHARGQTHAESAPPPCFPFGRRVAPWTHHAGMKSATIALTVCWDKCRETWGAVN